VASLELAGRGRRLLAHAASLCGFTVLAVAWTWPLAADPGGRFVSVVADPGPLARADPLLVSWIVAWVGHALRHAPLALFDTNAFHPLGGTLAFSDHLVAGGLLVLPLGALGAGPVLGHNVLLLATFAIGGAGTAALVRTLGGSWPAALAAGTLAFFGPHRLALLGHVHALSLHWLPFVLLALHRTLRTGSRRAALALAAALALQGLSGVYQAYYAAVALAVLLGSYALVRCPAAPGGYRRAVGAAVAAALLVAAVMLPFATARDTYVLARDPNEAFMMSARGVSYLGAILHPLVHLRQRFLEAGWPAAMLGVGTLLLAVAGSWRGAVPAAGGRRLAVVYTGVALSMALLSLGPCMQLYPALEGGVPGPHLLLAGLVPGFDALRVPSRALSVSLLALAVLAGLGVDGILARVRGRRTALAGLAVLLVFEIWHPPLRAIGVPWATSVSPRPRWLAARTGREAIVELPLGAPAEDARAMVESTRHWRPLVNGYSGFLPAGYYLRRVLASFPDERSLALLRGLGVRYAVVNDRGYRRGAASPCARLAAAPEAGVRLAFSEAGGCVVELTGAAPVPAVAGPRLAVERVVSSSGDELAADGAGTLARPWSQAVEAGSSGWLQVDLVAPARVATVVLHLGRRFGLFLRQYRVETSLDGRTWRTVRDEPVGEAPLVAYARDPSALRVRIDLPPTAARHVRLVRTGDRREGAFDLWPGWHAWGVAGVEVRRQP
jgi:hypothetical protein